MLRGFALQRSHGSRPLSGYLESRQIAGRRSKSLSVDLRALQSFISDHNAKTPGNNRGSPQPNFTSLVDVRQCFFGQCLLFN